MTEFSVSFSVVVQVFLALCALMGSLIGLIYKNLKEDLGEVKTEIKRNTKHICENRESSQEKDHDLETQQMAMMQTVADNFVKKQDCDKIHERENA